MQAKQKIWIMSGLTIVMVVAIKLFLPAPIKNTELRNEFWLRKTYAQPI
jgi:hypothetical protein